MLAAINRCRHPVRFCLLWRSCTWSAVFSVMASTQEAKARETRADAKEDLVHLTSGAKERLDHAKVSAQAALQKVVHPFDKEARKKVDEKAVRKKAEVSAKLQEVRNRATQEAEQERVAVLAQMGQPAEAVGAPPGSQDSPYQAPDPSRARPEDATSEGVPPPGHPEGGVWTAGPGQAQASRDQGSQSAHGPGTPDVDTKEAATHAPGTEAQAPPPAPNYHNPFH